MSRNPVYLALSLDVEEEGLFGGRYVCQNPPVLNTSCLPRLQSFLERGVKPTLFCAYSVFSDDSSRKIIARLADKYDMEIGAHLHHWNTPPLYPKDARELRSVPASQTPGDLIDMKLEKLLELGRKFYPIKSFRMGRWDLHENHWSLLLKHGIKCDASVRPMHAPAHGCLDPDHFHAPVNPYWAQNGKGRIFEVPLTVTPIMKTFNSFMAKQPAHVRGTYKKWGCLALLPVEHPLWLMKLTTLLHIKRGGNSISLTWHSSEMMPGGAPHMPDGKTVNRFLLKIENYLQWLEKKFDIKYETINGMRHCLGAISPVAPAHTGDWNFKQYHEM